MLPCKKSYLIWAIFYFLGEIKNYISLVLLAIFKCSHVSVDRWLGSQYQPPAQRLLRVWTYELIWMEYIPAWVYAHNMSKLEFSFVSRKDFHSFFMSSLLLSNVFLISFCFLGKIIQSSLGNTNRKRAPAILWKT